MITPICHPDEKHAGRGLCKRCHKKEWDSQHPTKNKEYFATKYARFVATLEEAKSVPCADCKQLYPRVCMDFDHVRGVKRFAVSTGINKSRKALLEEIAKCDVVCSNCHRIRTAMRLEDRNIGE